MDCVPFFPTQTRMRIVYVKAESNNHLQTSHYVPVGEVECSFEGKSLKDKN